MYQDERKLDFKPIGMAIKKAREAKGWTQEYLAQLVDLTPRSIMYIENRGQHPRLNKFYLITTLLGISVDQFFLLCSKGHNKKNWMTINTIRGAQASAIIYSITETARSNNLNVYYYISHLLTEIPKLIDQDGNIDPADLDYLMPWSDNLPEECRRPRRL